MTKTTNTNTTTTTATTKRRRNATTATATSAAPSSTTEATSAATNRGNERGDESGNDGDETSAAAVPRYDAQAPAPPDYEPKHNPIEAGLISSQYRRYNANDVANLIGDIGYTPNNSALIVENFARRFFGESSAMRATSASDLIYRLEEQSDGAQEKSDDDSSADYWTATTRRLRAANDAAVNMTLREMRRFYAQEKRRADRAEDLAAGRVVYQKGLARQAVNRINELLTIDRPSERKLKIAMWLDEEGTSETILALLRPVRRQANYGKLLDAKRRIMTLYGLDK